MSLRAVHLLAAVLAGCGATTPTPEAPPPLDGLRNVYLRGAPTTSRPRVALTFDAFTPCTASLLGRLREPTPGASALRATFFVDAPSLEREAEAHPEALRAALARLVAEGHALALRVEALPAGWRSDPIVLRDALIEAEARLARAVVAHGGGEGGLPRLWRPPADLTSLRDLASAGEVDRALVLWTRRVEAHEPLLARLAGGLGDGDIVSLPGGGPDCPVVEAVPALAAALAAAGLETVTVPEILAPALDRYAPVRVARYFGPGLTPACAEALQVTGDAEPEAPAPRWGLVDGEGRGGRVRVLPLPGPATATDAFVTGALESARALWTDRARWRALPACLRDVTPHRLESPVTARRASGHRARLWVSGPGGVLERDARAIGPPGRAIVLPTRADLRRLEARARLPERLRGVVADALERVGLESPVLVEARPTAGLVVRAALAPSVLEEPLFVRRARLEAAVAGYVWVHEVSLGEYLCLAAGVPGHAAALARAARAAEGLVPMGPFLTLPAVVGGAPHSAALATRRDAAGVEPPDQLLTRVLQAGITLMPGDTVLAEPAPLAGPPVLPTPGPASLRDRLVMALVKGFVQPVYSRPGHLWRSDGDLLGRQSLRLAVAPGVAVPTAELRPLAEPPSP